MSNITISEVAEILINDATLLLNWRQLAAGLGIRNVDYAVEEMLVRNGTGGIKDLFEKILDCWRQKQSRHSETTAVKLVCDKLKSLHYVAVAEEIERAFPDMRLSCAHNLETEKVKCSLGASLKWWPETKPLVNSFVERTVDGMPLVDKLHEMLKPNEKKDVVSKKACISGLGGIGKTTVAKWYANTYSDKFDHVLWLNCGENTLPLSIECLCSYLCISEEINRPLALAQRARQCFSALGDCDSLIVYDNAEAYDGERGIRPALPPCNEFPNINCLITSRWSSWGTSRGHGSVPQLSLETFSMEESVNFFKKNLLVVSYTIEELEDLAELLGHLPLALQIAAFQLNTYYSETAKGVSSYADSLRRSYDGLFMAKLDVGDYTKGLVSILNETKPKVLEEPESGKLAWNILCQMAFLRCENVGVRFLASVEMVEETAALAACDILKKHCLLTISKSEGHAPIHPKDDHYISVHRLLQKSIKRTIIADNELTVQCSRILGSSVSDRDDVWYKWEPYLEAKNLPDELQEIRVAKKQIYEVITIERFLKAKRYTDALELLHLYEEVEDEWWDYYKCQHERITSNSLYRRIVPCSSCKITHTKYRVLVSLFHGFVLHMSGKYEEALKFFEASIVKAKFVRQSKEPKLWYGVCRQLLRHSPFKWDMLHLPMTDVWNEIYVWTSATLRGLQRNADILDTLEVISKYCKTASKTPKRCGYTLKVESIVPAYSTEIYLWEANICYASCVAWLGNLQQREFVSYEVFHVNFVDLDGEVLREVDYHKVLPIRCNEIYINCAEKDGEGEDVENEYTQINFHMSQISECTKKLALKYCKVVWNFSPGSGANLEELSLIGIADEFKNQI